MIDEQQMKRKNAENNANTTVQHLQAAVSHKVLKT